MKKIFDEWFMYIGVCIILLGITIGLVIALNDLYTSKLENNLKKYQDYYECINSGVDYRVCEIQFIK